MTTPTYANSSPKVTDRDEMADFDAREITLIGVTKRVFVSLQSGANAQGTRLLVVLIPTKERVYCPYLRQSGTQMPDALARTCEGEERVKQELAQFLAAHTIAYVDVTPALEEQVQQHVQIYPKGEDSSHPQAAGYRVIARTVYAAVSRPPFGL